MNVRGRAVPLFILAFLLLIIGCFTTGITGPTALTIGQSATYDITFETDNSGANGTAYVFIDVPSGWTLTSATYDATVNGASTSGSATTGVSQSGTPCVAVGGPAAGYQRLGFSATFPTVTTSDSGTLHLTFTIGGAAGGYTLSTFGGGSFGGPSQQCNSDQTQTLDVVVTDIVALAPPTVAKAFAPASIEPGDVSRLTITLANANATALTGAAFTDTYPGGLVNAAPANAATTCSGGLVSSTTNSVTLSGGTIPANGSCTVSIDVTAAAEGDYANAIPAGAVTTTNGGANTAASNTATLDVATAPAFEAIPTLDEYALIALAGILALFAAAKLRF